jgi:DNA-binding NarL/FixJ family response regulator
MAHGGDGAQLPASVFAGMPVRAAHDDAEQRWDRVDPGLRPAGPIRVVIADDAYLIREALQSILADAEGVEVVRTVGDLNALRAAVREERPDAVLTDIRMPPTGTDEGIQVARELREHRPEVGVVVLSQFADSEYMLALLESGAERRAYLLKERIHDARELVSAIETVVGGGSFVDPKIVDVLVRSRSIAERSPLADLTPREQEVLALLAQGKSNAAIADSLDLTKRAVEKHINSIFMKLGLASVDEVSHRVKAALMYLAESEGSGPANEVR